jgi:magnesium transporter
MLYQALDSATDQTWRDIKNLFSQIEIFEQKMFTKDVKPQSLLTIKKKLNQIDYAIGHLASVAKQLQNLCPIQGDMNWKLRDLHDHSVRINTSMAMYSSQITTTIELYWGLQANRSNTQIKQLTLLACISMPLTFWASFFGMNFSFIPFNEPKFFYGALGLMLISVLSTIGLLVKKGFWSDS